MRGLRHRSLLQDVESGDSVGFGHGGKVEDLLDEEIRGRSRGDGRLTQMDEFGGALAKHLNTEHPCRAALAEERQESHGLARDVGARDLAEVGSADYQIDLFRRSLALRQADAGNFRNRLRLRETRL